MRPTETGSTSVFAHPAPYSDPCAEPPFLDDVLSSTDPRPLPITASTPPAPTASVRFETRDYLPLIHLRLRTHSTRGEYRGGPDHSCKTIATNLGFTTTTTRTDAHPLTPWPFWIPPANVHPQIPLLGVNQTDDSEKSMMCIAGSSLHINTDDRAACNDAQPPSRSRGVTYAAKALPFIATGPASYTPDDPPLRRNNIPIDSYTLTRSMAYCCTTSLHTRIRPTPTTRGNSQ